MPTRAQRTDTIVNIADFGALPGLDGTHANTNATAIADALGVSTKVVIPATPDGQWYAFSEIGPLPAGVELFGEGPTRTRLRYYPTGTTPPPALQFAQTFSRGRLYGFRLNGPVVYPNSTQTGISFQGSQFNWVHDVWIEDFAVGVTFNVDPGAGYSAHNILERFEIQRITGTGVFLGGGSNAETVGPGRCQYILNAGENAGVSIYLSGTFALPLGVGGPNGIVVRSVACDTAFECLRIENSRGVLVTGCFFEPGDGTPPRRMMNIDAASEDVSLVGNAFSPPGPPADDADRTPMFVQQVPEARGPALEGPSFPALGYFNQRTQGASTSGATAAAWNRIKNADMSRGTWGWPTAETTGGGVQDSVPGSANYVIGGRSTRLIVGSNPLFHMYQDFVLNSGLRSVTVGVRYRLLTTGTNAFRFDLYDVASATRLGYYSDTAAGGGTTTWKVRSLTARFEGLTGGVQGPRTLRVRIYPYNRTSPGPSAQQVLVDSVWLVDGEYAAPYRPYSEGIELLRGDDREIFYFGTVNASTVTEAKLPTNVPANAVGMIVEARIKSTLSATTTTYMRIDDNEGSAGQQVRELYAQHNNRWVMTDYLIPITPGGTLPQWQVIGGNNLMPPNTVDYAVRLKAWVLRM
jgi:hypothetical protein